MTRRNEFDWRKHLDRMLKRISNNPDKKVVVKKNNPIQVKISEQRLELIRYLRARYPNKHPLELAEMFTRYFNIYGTYKPPTKQKKTMDITQAKSRIKKEMKSIGLPLTKLEEVTPYTKSTISSMLAPSGDPSPSFMREVFSGVDKLKSSSVADNMKQMEEQFGNKSEGSEEDIDIDKDISSDISDGIVYKFKKGERALSKFSGVPIHYINLHRSNMLVRLTNGWELYVYIKVDDDGNPYLGVSKKSVEEVQ